MFNPLVQCPAVQSPFPLSSHPDNGFNESSHSLVNQIQKQLGNKTAKIAPGQDTPVTMRLAQWNKAMQKTGGLSSMGRLDLPWETLAKITKSCTDHAKTCAKIIPEVEKPDEIIINDEQGEPMCLGALTLCLLMAADCMENPDTLNSVELICHELKSYADNPKEDKKRPFFSDDRLVQDFLQGPCATLMPYCSESPFEVPGPEQPEQKPSSSANGLQAAVKNPLMVMTSVVLALGLASSLR